MKEYLEQHQAELTVRGPVFIGNGRELNKKEYIFLPGKKVGILDIGKLYQLVQSKGMGRSFEDFMLKDHHRNLRKWLEMEDILKEAENRCLRYVLKQDAPSAVKGPMKIMEFVKDAYGMPYVPGSTLKGMLRGILMVERLLKEESLRLSMQKELRKEISVRRNRKIYLSSICKSMERKIFHTMGRDVKPTQDAVNDVMSGFIVSDSSPIRVEQLVLAQKVEYHVQGETKNLNLLRESLCPGTKISFTITVDKTHFPEIREHLMKVIEIFDSAYNENFLCRFSGMDLLRSPQIFLGGGVGFLSKTVLYPLMGKKEGVMSAVEIFKQTGVPMKHNHHRDQMLGVSPHILKCTRYGGKILQIGLCDFSID